MLRNWFLVVTIVSAMVMGYTISSPSEAYAQSENECWAVIVGVSDYLYDVEDASHNDKAAEDLSSQLVPIWGAGHIKLLTNSEATKANIKDAIYDWLAPREDGKDTVMFFFAGHGTVDYIAPSDALTTSKATLIGASELDGWLDTLESQRVAIIIESCYSGSFIDNLSQSGRVVLTSCATNEDSAGNSNLGQFYFPYYLLQGLGKLDDIDVNRDNAISAEELYLYAAPKVTDYRLKTSGTNQHPQIGDYNAGELTLFNTATVTFHAEPAIAPISIDGKNYAPGQLPVSFTWATGTVHTFSAPIRQINDPQKEGIRYLFSSWGGGDNSGERRITVSKSETYVADYKTQYRLTLVSDYAETGGGGWYDANSEVVYSLSSDVVGHEDGSKHRFIGWDLGETNTSGRIIMDSPKVVTAKWQVQPTSKPGPSPRNWRTIYTVIAAMVAVLALLSLLLIGKRRNKPAMVASPVAGAKLILPDNSEISLAEAIRLVGRSDFDRAMSPGALRYISRQHLLIRSEQGRYFVEDYNSANGTKTNGIDIRGKGRQELKNGDRIDVADLVTLTFKVCNLPQRL